MTRWRCGGSRWRCTAGMNWNAALTRARSSATKKTGKTFWFPSCGHAAWERYPTPDRETGALRRLATIMARYPSLAYYVQGDPRGAALYIGAPDQMTDSRYSQGVAVYK